MRFSSSGRHGVVVVPVARVLDADGPRPPRRIRVWDGAARADAPRTAERRRAVGGTGGSTGAPGFDRLLPGGARGVVGRCRDFVSESLAARGWLDDTGERHQAVVEDVLLMTSELVTNACLHGGGPRQVTVRAEGSRLRVEVADANREQPRLRPLTPPARPGGHGLRVVERLADRWGSTPWPGGGKVVWFEIEHG
jgi:hypothetical protein